MYYKDRISYIYYYVYDIYIFLNIKYDSYFYISCYLSYTQISILLLYYI